MCGETCGLPCRNIKLISYFKVIITSISRHSVRRELLLSFLLWKLKIRIYSNRAYFYIKRPVKESKECVVVSYKCITSLHLLIYNESVMDTMQIPLLSSRKQLMNDV